MDIIDDDVRGLVFTPSALRMAEGTTASYEVALTSEPLGPVNVAVSATDGAALTAQPTALTFAPAAWRETQTVTVTAALDEDALVPAPAILAHATTGADYARFPGAGFPVEVSETTLPLLFFDPTELSVLESAGTVTLTVRMGQPSSRDVEVEVATADGTAYGSRPDYTGDFGTLRRRVTFAAGELTQTFDVAVHNDDRYEEEETFLVQLRAAANGAVGVAASRHGDHPERRRPADQCRLRRRWSKGRCPKRKRPRCRTGWCWSGTLWRGTTVSTGRSVATK